MISRCVAGASRRRDIDCIHCRTSLKLDHTNGFGGAIDSHLVAPAGGVDEDVRGGTHSGTRSETPLAAMPGRPSVLQQFRLSILRSRLRPGLLQGYGRMTPAQTPTFNAPATMLPDQPPTAARCIPAPAEAGVTLLPWVPVRLKGRLG